MPICNTQGIPLSGIPNASLSIDRQVIRENSGWGGWLTDTKVVYQNNNGPSFIESYDLTTKEFKRESNLGASRLYANNGIWAGQLLGGAFVVRTNRNPNIAVDCYLWGVGFDGTVLTSQDRTNSGTLRVYNAEGTLLRVVLVGSTYMEAFIVSETTVGWKADDGRVFVEGVEVPLIGPVWEIKPMQVDGEAWVVYQSNGFAVVQDLKGHGMKIGQNEPAQYAPHGAEVDGELRIWYSTTAGERPQDLRLFTASTQPQPQPAPQPTPMTIPCIHLTKRLWLGAFHGVKCQYPDNPHPFGNVLVQTNPGSITAAGPMGWPMIASAASYDPNFVNTTIAYYTSAASPNDLQREFNSVAGLPEKPVILYLDSRDWPVDCPVWLDKSRTWIGLQAYRNAGESLASYTEAITSLLARFRRWGVPVMLITQFYDRNFTVPLVEVLEIQPLWADWLNEYDCAGMLMFSDRRPSGMVTYPELAAWARAYSHADIGRPNRFDYWLPKTSSMDAVLRNKLGQTSQLVTLSDGQKKFILELLDAAKRKNPPPT